MKISPERQQEALRHGIRGALSAYCDEAIWDTRYACTIFGLDFDLRRHPENRKKSDTKNNLGLDRHEESLSAEFNALMNDKMNKCVKTLEPPSTIRLFAVEPDPYSSALDPKFHEFVYCRPEVALALSVVALENGMD